MPIIVISFPQSYRESWAEGGMERGTKLNVCHHIQCQLIVMVMFATDVFIKYFKCSILIVEWPPGMGLPRIFLVNFLPGFTCLSYTLMLSGEKKRKSSYYYFFPTASLLAHNVTYNSAAATNSTYLRYLQFSIHKFILFVSTLFLQCPLP